MSNKNKNGFKFEFSFKVILFTITFTTISILLVYNLLLVKKTDLYSGQFLEHTLDSYLNILLKDINGKNSNSLSKKDSSMAYLQKFIDNSGKLIFLTMRVGVTDFPITFNSDLKKITTFKNGDRSSEFMKQIEIIRSSENYKKISFTYNNNKFDIHFSIYDNLDMLKYFPFIQLLVITFLTILTYFGYSFFKSNKESEMWVAMSKETAHQLGTPITSLSGWKDYLYEIKSDILKEHKKNGINTDIDIELDEIHRGIGIDIGRINLVLERFSKIASDPEMGYHSISDIIKKVSDYLSTRIPNKEKSIEIQFKSEVSDVKNIYMSKILIEWTIENLIKNSLQAIEFDKKGVIEIILKDNKNKVIIDIKDNGIGLKNSQFKQIFEAGYTTKKRGWGIGLSLAKRVIEEYHDGKLFVLKSKLHQGTTIRIVLNKLV